ncbi:hypothetical protein S7335_749 [Synechococcus sp. PCC 7335]|nr:hypothetical protein S7335_749 [Synechococcus sp. PCC 7335]
MADTTQTPNMLINYLNSENITISNMITIEIENVIESSKKKLTFKLRHL